MAFRDEPTAVLLRKMWKHSTGHKRMVVGYLALSVVANLIDFTNPLIIAWLLDTIAKEGLADPQKIVLIMGLLLVAQIGFWAFHGPSRVLERRAAFLTSANYKQHLLSGVLALPLSWHAEHHSGDTIDRVEKASGALYQFSSYTFEVVQTIVRLVSSFFALVYFNIHSMYLVAFLSFVAIYVMLAFDKRLKEQYVELNEQGNKIATKIFDVISNISTVVILKIEQLLSKEIWRKIMSPYRLYSKNTTLGEWKWFWVSTIASLMIVSVIGSYLLQSWTLGAAISVGTLYALYGYVERINGLFFRFAYRYGDIVRHKASIENAAAIEEQFHERIEIEPFSLHNWNELRIDGLSFAYQDAKSELHIRDADLRIGRGQRIAFVGQSGSGKTTMLKLLGGLYTPTAGKVLIDGSEVEEGFEALSPYMTLIPQEPELFATTIEENITMGVDYPKDVLAEHVRMARFDSVVQRLPSGYASEIREKGVNLSGGEKQRLALARGLLAARDKEIVLLDEPTSSVDAANEIEIYESIFETFSEKTVISTIHRLHLLHRFDRIYVFSGGEIEASGTVEQLLEQSPAFKSLWERYWKENKR